MFKKGISPDKRKNNVFNVVSKFNPYLLSPPPPGSVLNCIERVAVACIAREAITYSDGLPDNVCTMPNFNFYTWMEKASIHFDFPSASNTSEQKKELLLKSVHAITRHQHRLDEDWYRRTQSKIQSVFLNPNKKVDVVDVNDSDVAAKLRCHQIFCEIMSIAIASSAIQMYFLTLDEKVPDLPTFEEAENSSKSHPATKDLNMMSLLKEVRWDDEVSDFAPYLKKEDVNKESTEYKEMEDDIAKGYINIVGKGPRLCFTFSPNDNIMLMDIVKCYYIKDEDMKNFWSFSDKCDGVTRFQLETIATGYSDAVECDY